MRKNRIKKWIGILLALCFVVGLLPTTAMAANFMDDNPAGGTVDEIAEGDLMDKNEGTVIVNNGEINHNYGTVTTHNGMMSYNYGTITANNGQVIENKEGGKIITNDGDGLVSYNYGGIDVNNGEVIHNYETGTIANNEGTVFVNFGTITSNSGTVTHNCGGTVTGGTVEHSYCYAIDLSGIENDNKIYFQSVGEATYRSGNKVYVKENAEIIMGGSDGYKFSDDSKPSITGNGTITDNGDGTYTLANITGDISLSATLTYVPVTDITGVPSTVYVGVDTRLNNNIAIEPEGASTNLYWEIVDPGTTGATIDDPYWGILSTTAKGEVKVKATIVNGKSENENFTKEFTITVDDVAANVLYDAYMALKAALAGDDLDALRTATEKYYAVLSTYSSLGEEYYDELAQMLGLPSGTDANHEFVKTEHMANVILQITKAYQAYLDKPNSETASAFSKYYNSIFNDPNSGDEELRVLVRKFIPDIDEVYAKALRENNNPTPEPTPTPKPTPTPEPTPAPTQTPELSNIPNTGDDSGVGLWIGLMMIALAGLAVCLIAWPGKRTN